jgi:asparagine synthase (glutamine-hydrolysing)
MCGICGFVIFSTSSHGDRKQILERMNSVQVHRGPDADGYFLDSRAALAMRRLSIIDVAGGKQPFSSEDRNLHLVFNGEIYNFKSLRKELADLGVKFRSDCDSEVIIHAYARWGTDAIRRLEGMFSIAIWNQKKEELLLIRDRLGKKPLHYVSENGRIAFASEIKSLLQLPWVKREPNLQAIDSYLRYKYFPANLTPFIGIEQVPAGSYIVFSQAKTPRVNFYWDLMSEEEGSPVQPSYNDALKQTKELVEVAVRDRMVSDVPLGGFLSGGIDSSIVVASMAKFSPNPVKTFCMGFKESSFDERRYARLVASKYKTEHHEFEVEIGSVLELIESLVECMDSPFGDSGAIPNYLVCKKTAGEVKVALSGLGADEAFAGYERYWVETVYKKYTLLPAWIRNYLIEPIVNGLPVSSHKKSMVARAKAFLSAAHLSLFERYTEIVSVFGTEEKTGLYNSSYTSWQSNYSERSLMALLEQGSEEQFLRSAFAADVKSILLNDYELITDRVSMANSLEVRAPFLDHRLMEFCYKLPSRYKLKGFKTKYILREAFQKEIPGELLNRGKFGFESSFSSWVRGELYEPVSSILLDERQRRRGLFDSTYINNLLNEHRDFKQDHSKKIFCLLTLELWFRKYID